MTKFILMLCRREVDTGGGTNFSRAPQHFQQRPEQGEGRPCGHFQGWYSSLADKVGQFGQLSVLKNKTSSKDFSLGFIFPGECQEVKKVIQNIFGKEYRKACLSSYTFQQCFNNTKIGAAFRNEKKLGALISKSKL